MQKFINKSMDLELIRETVEMAKEVDMYVEALWMVGFPGESMEEIEETLDCARRIRAHLNTISIALPYPGTKLHMDAASMGLLHSEGADLDEFDYFRFEPFRSDSWDYAALRDLVYDANIELNFLNSPSIDGGTGRAYILENEDYLMEMLPEHVVANITMGYLFKLEGADGKCSSYYGRAAELLERQPIYDTFGKYLAWDYPVVHDFNKYLAGRGLAFGNAACS